MCGSIENSVDGYAYSVYRRPLRPTSVRIDRKQLAILTPE
jgi:hypothetical protein